MKSIILIEEDEQYQAEVRRTSKELNDKYHLYSFYNLKEFYDWFSELLKAGQDEREIEIDLFMVDFDSFKDISIDLLQKTQKALVEKGLADEKNPPSYIITTHEDPHFDIDHYLHPIINNVLYKPFDRLILKETMQNALNGRKPIDSSLYRQKAKTTVDMIKLINISGITELGFRTKATRPIPYGPIAKYYGEVFKDHNIDFTYAYCYHCVPYGEEFQCHFSYFGVGLNQINIMRRYIHTLEDRKPMVLDDHSTGNHEQNIVYIVTTEIENYRKINALIFEQFENVKCIPILRVEYLYARLDEKQKQEYGIKQADSLIDQKYKHRIVIKDQKFCLLQSVDEKGETQDLDKFGNLNTEDIREDRELLCKYFPTNSMEQIFDNTEKLLDDEGILEVTQGESLGFLKVLSVNKAVDENLENTIEIDLISLSPEETEVVRKKKYSVEGTTNAIFLDGFFAAERHYEKVNSFIKVTEPENKDFKVLALSDQPIFNEKQEERYSRFDDMFCLPTDRYYFARKMKQLFPHWRVKGGEKLTREVVEYKDKIKTARSIPVESISETFIILKYNRAFPVGEIREFKLKMANELGAPEILAMCNYCQKISDDSYTLHFLFFGITAKQRGHIRRWMKAQYLMEKNGLEV